jgi:hypothetical protein
MFAVVGQAFRIRSLTSLTLARLVLTRTERERFVDRPHYDTSSGLRRLAPCRSREPVGTPPREFADSRIQNGPYDAPRPGTGQSACPPQHVRSPRKSPPSCGTLCRHVSRQVLVEFRSHHCCGLLVDRRPTLAWVHRTFLSRFEVYPRCAWDARPRLWRASLHPRGMGRTWRSPARHDDAHQLGDRRRLWLRRSRQLLASSR